MLIALLFAVPTAAGVGASGGSTHGAAPRPVGASPSAAAPSPAAPSAPAGRVTQLESLEAALHRDHVPAAVAHPPNILGARPGRSGPVAPTYGAAPAPMGLADLGLENASGTTVGYDLNTSSVEGAADLTRAESVYLDGDGPDTFGIQMNAVATNVTLFGKSSYQFWAQDFLSYTPSNGSLTLGDNVWNLSDASGNLSANAIYAHGPNGTVVAPIFYYAIGPTFTVSYPFNVTFYLNATDVGNRPTLFFNYSIRSAALTASGSFDYVIFNSSRLLPFTPAPVPQFQANGTGLDPFGLPNDLELVLVGDDDGDTTTFFDLVASFALATWDAGTHAYVPIASALDVGSDTGETSDGVAVTYADNATTGATIPVAQLTLGPSFLQGLWNDSGAPGYRGVSLRVIPTNAFVLVNPGTAYAATAAQWVPTIPLVGGPRVNVTLPPTGDYFVETMLSDYTPVGTGYTPTSLPANATTRVGITLTRTVSAGVYTPLLAWGNAELRAISASGSGTAAAPYVLERNQVGPIAPVFGAVNDFLFPVFPGLLLIGTTDYVHATPPTFEIAYPTAVAANLSAAGLPTKNDLQIECWNVSNVSLLDTPEISGWLSADVPFSPSAEVILWGSTGNLVAGNTFYDEGIALATYGGSNNTIWGNSFLNSTPPAPNLSAVFNAGNNTTGLFESESGDLVYNNYFAVPAPAYTPTIDPVSCQNICEPVTYTDTWNVSYAPAATVVAVLGTNLSGSIIGTTYQGGNYWSNYGTPSNPLGVLPYNDTGRITVGGDYLPLVRSVAYAVSVDESGLATGTVWGVTALGATTSTNATELTIFAPNGTFNYTVEVPAGYSGPANGSFAVNGTGTAFTLTFVPLVAVEFTETGLVAEWAWNVSLTLGGSPPALVANSSATSLTIDVAPGSYDYAVGSYGYLATPATGTLTVGATPGAPVAVAFAILPVLNVTATGFPAGEVDWTVYVTDSAGEQAYTSNALSIALSIFQVPAGPFSWDTKAPGYSAEPAAGSGVVPGSTNVTVTFAYLVGTLEGTVSPAGAELWVGLILVPLAAGAFLVHLPEGLYAITVIAPGFVSYYNNVSVVSAETSTLAIVLTAVPSSPSSGPLGVSPLGWGLIGALAVLAAVGLAAAVIARRRRPPAPPPVTPYVAAPAAAAAEATSPTRTPAPWEEGPADSSAEPPTVGPR